MELAEEGYVQKKAFLPKTNICIALLTMSPFLFCMIHHPFTFSKMVTVMLLRLCPCELKCTPVAVVGKIVFYV